MTPEINIEETLLEIERSGHVPDWICEEPGEFLSDLYALWVTNGGTVAGKNRNSIRNIANWLGPTSQVKSLPQKLRGAIKLKEADAAALVRLFLDRWKPVVAQDDGAEGDTDFQSFPAQRRESLVENLIQAIYTTAKDGKRRHVQLREAAGQRMYHAEVLASPDVHKRMFAGADALVVFSRHRSVANENFLAPAMEPFWQILRGFSDVLATADRQRTVIWILNIGNRQVEDKNAWRDFINVEILKAQLEAFAHFDTRQDLHENPVEQPQEGFEEILDQSIRRKIEMPSAEHRQKRWQLLVRNSIFIIEHLRDEEIQALFPEEMAEDKLHRVQDIGVFAEHLLPHALPPAWTNITRLYPDEMKSVSDATFAAMIHLKKGKEATDVDVEYYAYAPLLKGPIRGRIGQVALDPPGEPYDQAFGLAYAAARYRLKDRFGKATSKGTGGRLAVRYLRKLGFEVLTIPDLFQIFSGTSLTKSETQ